METTTRYADSSGVSIAYQVHGEGRLDLVFVPGFVSHVELIWDEPTVAAFFRRLASFARLVILYGTYARMLRAPDYPVGIPSRWLDRLTATIRRESGGPLGIELWAPSVAGEPGFEAWWARLLRYGTSPAGAIALMELYRELDVRVALRGELGSLGLEFADRGVHALRGVPGEWRLFAVDSPPA